MCGASLTSGFAHLLADLFLVPWPHGRVAWRSRPKETKQTKPTNSGQLPFESRQISNNTVNQSLLIFLKKGILNWNHPLFYTTDNSVFCTIHFYLIGRLCCTLLNKAQFCTCGPVWLKQRWGIWGPGVDFGPSGFLLLLLLERFRHQRHHSLQPPQLLLHCNLLLKERKGEQERDT